MTIDEISRVMEFFLHKQCCLERMKYTPYDNDNTIWEAVNTVFQEWKWYRKQDLIKRKDAIEWVHTKNYCDYCDSNKKRPCFEEKCDNAQDNIIKAIPKAEPMSDIEIIDNQPCRNEELAQKIKIYCEMCQQAYDIGDIQRFHNTYCYVHAYWDVADHYTQNAVHKDVIMTEVLFQEAYEKWECKYIPKAEPSKMRDANTEEIQNTNDYLKTISEPTGIHFEAEQLKDYSLYTNKPIEVHNKDDWDRFQKDIEPTSYKMEQIDKDINTSSKEYVPIGEQHTSV